MPGNYSKLVTVITGQTITASERNNEFDNVINNMTPDGVDDASANTAAMQATVDPSGANLATALRGEIQRLRFQLLKLGSASGNWYDALPFLAGLTPAAAGATATDLNNRLAQLASQIKIGFGLTNWFDSALTVLLRSGGTLTGGITITGPTGTGFRTDSSLEISRTYSGGNGPLLSLFSTNNPGTTGEESALAYGAKDSAGTTVKLASISARWADATTLTGYATLRLNATSAGGTTDNTDIQIYGAHGIRLFAAPNLAGPGAGILEVNGTTTQPSQPSFLVTNATGATDITGDGTAYTVLWPTEVFDQANNFASNTFTAPVTGRYLLSVSILVRGLTSSHSPIVLALVTSNREYRSTYIGGTTTLTSIPMHICVLADMAAAQTATVVLTVSGGTKVVDIDTDAKQNYFSGSLMN